MKWLYLLLVLGMFAPGCGEPILYQKFDKAIWANYIHSNQLKPGMTKLEVTGLMGQPQIKEEADYSGGHYTFYFYRTHDMDFEGFNTVRGGYTPLVLKGDRLVGIGKRDYYRATDRYVEEEFPGLPASGIFHGPGQ